MTAKPNPAHASPSLRRALVVFSGQTELWWLRFLRRGFRHCFVVMELPGTQEGHGTQDGQGAQEGQGGRAWALYNPLSVGTQLAVWPDVDEATLRAWLVEQGYRLAETHVQPLRVRVYGWRPYTCVEGVKRVLGLHAPGVFTPWQLYCAIKKYNKRKIILDNAACLGYNSH